MSKSKNQNKPVPALEKSAFIATESVRHYSGPLPDPETLGKYDLVVPGSAERIIRMAEEEAKARRDNERKSIVHSITLTYLGIIFAFFSVIIISWLVWYAIAHEFGTVGASIAVGCIAAVAGVFIFFRRSKKREQ